MLQSPRSTWTTRHIAINTRRRVPPEKLIDSEPAMQHLIPDYQGHARGKPGGGR
jgi:hypothetical protein